MVERGVNPCNMLNAGVSTLGLVGSALVIKQGVSELRTQPVTLSQIPARFADNARLQDHFRRHGADFGLSNPPDYEAQAARFLAGRPSQGILEIVRTNGDIVRYNTSTNEFGIITQDGIIRTYFKPDPAVHGYPSNMEYFYAQRR